GGTVGFGHGVGLLDQTVYRVLQPGAHQAQVGKAWEKGRIVAGMLGHDGINDLGYAWRVTLAFAVGGRDLRDDHDLAIRRRKRRGKLGRKGALWGKAQHVLVEGERCQGGRHGYDTVEPPQALVQET